MEPTQTNKTKIIIIIAVVVVIVIVGLIFILKSKKETSVAPEENVGEIVTVNPVVLENESKEINRYIDEATTFGNEASLVEIEKEF